MPSSRRLLTCAAFGGETVNLFPFTRARGGVPRPLYGLHLLPTLRRLKKRHSLNHIYFFVLYYFPILRFLRKPTVYTVVASLGGQAKPAHLACLQALHRARRRGARKVGFYELLDHTLSA
jgi:hypothetical protein